MGSLIEAEDNIPLPRCPAVSVLLPVYNAGAALARAVGSSLDQRGVELELVIVDDGSTDGSRALLEIFARRDKRVRLLFESHCGLVGALNRGLAECRGEYVARMDADDAMLPGRLARQVEMLEERLDLAGVGCLVRVEPEGELTDGARRYIEWNNSLVTPEDIRREIFIESPLVHPTVTLRRKVLTALGEPTGSDQQEPVGYASNAALDDRSMNITDARQRSNAWRRFDGPEDYDLWLRLILDRGLKLAKAPEALHVWNDRPDRLTRTDPRYRPAAFLALKAGYLAKYEIEPHGGYVLWGCGPVGKALMRELAKRGWKPAAIVEVHPGRIGEVIGGAPVIPVERAGDYRGFVHLGAVGRAGARSRMREAIAGLGLTEGEDFFFTA